MTTKELTLKQLEITLQGEKDDFEILVCDMEISDKELNEAQKAIWLLEAEVEKLRKELN